MTSFLIGTVLEPETKEFKAKEGGYRKRLDFAILSGRVSTQFSVWDGDKTFEDVSCLMAGEIVCAIVNSAIDKHGRLVNYMNCITTCPEEIRSSLLELFK